jgi:hypothetical protein
MVGPRDDAYGLLQGVPSSPAVDNRRLQGRLWLSCPQSFPKRLLQGRRALLQVTLSDTLRTYRQK